MREGTIQGEDQSAMIMEVILKAGYHKGQQGSETKNSDCSPAGLLET